MVQSGVVERLDAALDPDLLRIAQLTQTLFDAPVALLSLVAGEVHCSAVVGLGVDGVALASGLAGALMGSEDVVVIPDLAAEPGFGHHPLVIGPPGLRAFVGVRVGGHPGPVLGSLCVLDTALGLPRPDKLRALRQLAQLVADNVAYRDLATIDELTGLRNRRGFLAAGAQLLALSDRLDQRAEVLFVDVDGLKAINDSLGHSFGDLALMECARLLEQTFRAADVIARWGGDEFAVLLTGNEDGGAEMAADRLAAALRHRNARGDLPFRLAASVGYARRDARGPALPEMLVRADAAMYLARREARRPIAVTSTLSR